MKLLHLDSSILGDNSVSRSMSEAVVEQLRQTSGPLEITYRDLASDPLPHVTLPRLATADAGIVLDEFLSADIIVIGAPMYNFGIPTQLKAWFDHVLIAGKTFRYGEDGAEGLASQKKVIVALSRGNIYSGDSPAAVSEHAEHHIRALLGFIGITDPIFVIAEGVGFGAEEREAAVAKAMGQISELRPLPLAA